jgi:hypothetical protein
VFAQGRLLMAESRAPLTAADCRPFIRVKPQTFQKAPDASKLTLSPGQGFDELNLKECFTGLAATLQAIADQFDDAADTLARVTLDGKDVTLSALDQYLIRQHLNIKNLEEWSRHFKITPIMANELDNMLDAAGEVGGLIDKLLSLRGLRELFSAALVSGAIVGTGQPVDGESGGEQTTAALAHVVWESKHFGDDRFSKVDFAFGGKFGFMPALSFVKEEGTAATEEAEAVYQEAFVWDLGGRVNFSISGSKAAEISAIGRVGQTMFGTQSVVLDRGDQSVLAVAVPNGAGKAEMFYEYGAQYNLYNNPLEVVHGEGSTVSPAFTIAFVFRNDSRFKKEGDFVVFDSPQQRMVLRFMVDALKIIDRRQLAEKQRVFTLGFGVEREYARGAGEKLPAGTKLIFRGDLDLLRALRGR